MIGKSKDKNLALHLRKRMILIQVPRRASAMILMNTITIRIGKGKRGECTAD